MNLPNGYLITLVLIAIKLRHQAFSWWVFRGRAEDPGYL
ncbi:MAG: hypothetical protein K0R62_7456 [Nonomuraea muscovyensis]|jgi:cytochrome bd-type quinol oxidase subunit 2|nr:hypothetical protein [Nonomuraea muscovyensis]